MKAAGSKPPTDMLVRDCCDAGDWMAVTHGAMLVEDMSGCKVLRRVSYENVEKFQMIGFR